MAMAAPPDWDMTPYFPEFDGNAYWEFRAGLTADVANLLGEVRTAALQGSNAAWEGIGDVAAACLNAIAGTRLELYRRRRVGHFLEPAVFDAGISRRTLDTMLDSRMQDGSAFLLNIPMRFLFERAVYEERAAGELTVSRLGELMAEVQRTCYGDTLSADELDPWFWAPKLHFYLTGISFYNFPYTFGYLFSLGTFARAKREGPSFFPVYEKLLQRTGSDSAEQLARSHLGIDLEGPDFWNASIDLIEADLVHYEEATGALFE
jgi:oligoendopeptidase F